MDIVVVSSVEFDLNTPEKRRLATTPGTRYGKLTVVNRNKLGNVVLRCDCGETVRLPPKQVVLGKRYQCYSCDGWLSKTPAEQILGSSIYKSFKYRGRSAKQRCDLPSCKYYKEYGARGIRFNFSSVEDYVNNCVPYALVHGTEGEVDRVNNNSHYEPGNIKIVSKVENIRNRRNTITIGNTSLGELAELSGIKIESEKYLYERVKAQIQAKIHKSEKIDWETVMAMFMKALKNKGKDRSRLSPRRKRSNITVEGIPLPKIIELAGYSSNKFVYNAVKSEIYKVRMGDNVYTVSHAVDRAKAYARKHGISPSEHSIHTLH